MMRKSAFSKLFALAWIGLGYQAHAACTKVYNNYNLTTNVSGCFEIYGVNITFNGNGHTITGSSAQASSVVVSAKGYNVTVKNLYVDCNTKSTGIEFVNAGSSNASSVSVRNCYTGVTKTNTGLVVSGMADGANNMFNNTFDIYSYDGTSTNIYTSDLDGASLSSTGFGVYVNGSPYYDYSSQFYLKNVGLLANNNSFFWLNQSWFGINAAKDLMLLNIPAAYLTNVTYTTSMVSNTKIIKN